MSWKQRLVYQCISCLQSMGMGSGASRKHSPSWWPKALTVAHNQAVNTQSCWSFTAHKFNENCEVVNFEDMWPHALCRTSGRHRIAPDIVLTLSLSQGWQPTAYGRPGRAPTWESGSLHSHRALLFSAAHGPMNIAQLHDALLLLHFKRPGEAAKADQTYLCQHEYHDQDWCHLYCLWLGPAP